MWSTNQLMTRTVNFPQVPAAWLCIREMDAEISALLGLADLAIVCSLPTQARLRQN